MSYVCGITFKFSDINMKIIKFRCYIDDFVVRRILLGFVGREKVISYHDYQNEMKITVLMLLKFHTSNTL